VSTIGYGHVTCKTKFGKVFTIVYSAIGVPLMMLFLANTGSSTATVFKFIYLRFDSIRQKYRLYKLKKHIFDTNYDDYEVDMFDEKLEFDEKTSFQDMTQSANHNKNHLQVSRRLSRANSLPNRKEMANKRKLTKSVEVNENEKKSNNNKKKSSKENSKQQVEEAKLDKKEPETKAQKANEKRKTRKLKEIQVPRSISIGIRDVELADDVVEKLRADFMRNAYEKEAISRINKLIEEKEVLAAHEDLKEIPFLKDIQLKQNEFDTLNTQLNEMKIDVNENDNDDAMAASSESSSDSSQSDPIAAYAEETAHSAAATL
jgi:hypothetical protein